jgi:hypothetical protein
MTISNDTFQHEAKSISNIIFLNKSLIFACSQNLKTITVTWSYPYQQGSLDSHSYVYLSQNRSNLSKLGNFELWKTVYPKPW